jgi:predicted nucleotidyltransferase
MPVRLLNSSVLKWPDAQSVGRAVRDWAEHITHDRDDVRQIGYFGSYARGDWGVGSDIDLVIVVDDSNQSFERRGSNWNLAELPVPADVLVYTMKEWEMLSQQSRFHKALIDEAIWIYTHLD